MLGSIGNAVSNWGTSVVNNPIGWAANPLVQQGQWIKDSYAGGGKGIFASPGGQGGGYQGGNMNDFLSMYPEYSQAYDPKTMSLADKMKGMESQYSSGLRELKGEATRKGASGWLNQARYAQDLAQKTAREKGAGEVAGQTAQARSALASQGGLSSGARERAGEQGMKNYMAMSQDLARQGTQANLGLSIQDQQNKMQAMQGLTGAEQARLNMFGMANQGDIQNAIGEGVRKNQYGMDIYKTRTQALATQRMADATAASGQNQKDGLLGMGILGIL